VAGEHEIVAAYQRSSGRSLVRFAFYIGLAAFKLAAILVGIPVDTVAVRPSDPGSARSETPPNRFCAPAWTLRAEQASRRSLYAGGVPDLIGRQLPNVSVGSRTPLASK
jgi:hypothetical protein